MSFWIQEAHTAMQPQQNFQKLDFFSSNAAEQQQLQQQQQQKVKNKKKL